MKIIIVVLFFFFLNLPTNIFCQDKFEAPKLTIGSFWKYENEKKIVFTIKLISIKNDGYLIRTGKNYGIYDKETLNLLFAADEEGNKIEKNPSIYRNLFNFPLFVGKTWEDSMISWSGKSRVRVLHKVSYKVEDYEDVLTPAGSLKALRVRMKVNTIFLETNSHFPAREAKFWLSPEAKCWIKREFYPGYWGAENAILLKYRLNK